MRFFYKLTVSSLFFLTFFTVRSQGTDLLKTFINKNNFAIRSVQKQCIAAPELFQLVTVKELLKYQVISVEQFSTDKKNCMASAYVVRKKCLEFFTAYSSAQLAVYSLSKDELTYFSTCSDLKNPDAFITPKLLQAINTVDEKNPYLFNDFTLAIR